MKTIFSVATFTFGLSLLTACSPESSNSSLDDLKNSLSAASNSMSSFEQHGSEVTKENAMDVFAKDYAKKLNSDPALAHQRPIEVKPGKDGSFIAYSDVNKNQIQDANEKDLVKLEFDAENKRLVASNEEGVSEQPFSGMGTGLLMGMLMGNMLSRQRMTGANPASKRATPRRSASPSKNQAQNRSPSQSMRSRAGSGSHASGK